jgi:preprotein translocase subunit SecE
MNEVVKTEGSGTADVAKLVTAVLLAVAGIVAFYVLKGQQAEWIRWLVFVVALLAGALVFWMSDYGRSTWKFVLDSRIELYKVVWPDRDKTRQLTIVVFLFVSILGVFFWGLDALLAWSTRALLGGGKGG